MSIFDELNKKKTTSIQSSNEGFLSTVAQKLGVAAGNSNAPLQISNAPKNNRLGDDSFLGATANFFDSLGTSAGGIVSHISQNPQELWQAPLRLAPAAVQAVSNYATKRNDVITPGTNPTDTSSKINNRINSFSNAIETLLLGKEPIGNISRESGDPTAQLGGELENLFGAEKGKIADNSWYKTLAGGPLIIGSILSNFDGLGGAKEAALKSIAKNSTEDAIRLIRESVDSEDVYHTMRDIGFDHQASELMSVQAPKVKTTAEARRLLTDAAVEQVQRVENHAKNRIAELDDKANGMSIDESTGKKVEGEPVSLSADEYKERQFLKKNAGNPQELLGFYADSTPRVSSAQAERQAVAGNVADAYSSGGLSEAEFSKVLSDKFGTDPAAADAIAQSARDLLDGGGQVDGEWLREKISNPSGQETGTAAKERGFVSSAKESPEVPVESKLIIGGEYVPRSNDELARTARERIAGDGAEATEKFAKSSSSDDATAATIELMRHYRELAAKESDELVKRDYYDKIADIVNTHAKKATEEGRAVQANALLERQSPLGVVRNVSRKIDEYNRKASVKVPELTGEKVSSILDTATDIEKMAEGDAKEIATKKFFDDLESIVPTPVWKKITTLWKAGLLTGIKTHGVNIISNFFNGIGEVAKDLPATGIDMVASMATGKRTKAFTLEGLPSGALEGFQKGWKRLRYGIEELPHPEGINFNKVNFGDGKIGKGLQAYTDTIYATLDAEDKVFFHGARARSLYEQALVTIKNEGKKFETVAEKKAWIQDFVSNPSEEALRNATLDANIATFRNDTALGNAAMGARKALEASGTAGAVVGNAILPFAKTPAAIAMQMINYSPAGFVKTFFENVGKGSFDQKAFSEGMGRAITGTAALWGGMQLFKNGKVTTGYPKDQKEQKLWELEGKKENSVRIGDKWVPLITFGPPGAVLGIGGYIQKGIDETGSLAGGIMTGLAGSGKIISEQTFLTGVKTLIDAINEPEKKGLAYAKSLAGSVIPTVVSDWAQATDKYQRQSSTVLDAVKARIPGARETLDEKLDVFGQRMERNRTLLGTALSPIRLTNSTENKITTEIERLKNLDQDVSVSPIDRNINGIKLDDKEYYKYQRIYGKVLATGVLSLINNEQYQNLPPDRQKELWDEGVTGLRKTVRETVFPELIIRRYGLPADTNKQALYKLMTELGKEDKFKNASSEKQGALVRKYVGVAQ